MRVLSLFAVVVFSMAPAPVASVSGWPVSRPQVQVNSPRDVFLQRVDEYVKLHRRLEADLPPEIVTEDPDRLLAPRIALGREIRKARVSARQGEIFTPAVADYFRGVITEALRAGRIENLIEIINEEDSVPVMATVNGDYPAGASISFMPPSLLAVLPPLPTEVEYRFLSCDLILWDLHAGLIVDFVPRALRDLTIPPGP
jgi:hypothetical protein